MSSTPRVSVVVPCHNRAAFLQVHLRSLMWSAVGPSEFEVIVVDDGGADPVADVAADWRRRGLDVRVLRVDRPAGLRNNACARNEGLRAARYPIVIQTDPDIVFCADILARARVTLVPGTFLSCSGYYPLTPESTQEIAFGSDGPADAPAVYLEQARGRPNQVLSPDGVGGLHGALVCWRDDLLQAGGYDESFRYWGWEDRELIVTLAHRGLVRQTMADTPVVHLWHPPARGELGREEMAKQGRVSGAAWAVQMQRASAEYPRPLRPAALRQLVFDARYLEAAALRSGGHVVLARDLLLQALHDPSEGKPPAPVHHQRTHRVLELLIDCEDLLGRAAARDWALAWLESLDDGRASAAAVRARTALRSGNLAAAFLEAPMLGGSRWDASRAALAIETALLADRVADAWNLMAGSAGDASAGGDLFEQMRGVEYLRLLQGMQPARQPSRALQDLEATAAGQDATEFVFSAAMRSRRAGLDIAAVLLFGRFIAQPGRSEDRLIREATRERAAAVERLERLGDPTKPRMPWRLDQTA